MPDPRDNPMMPIPVREDVRKGGVSVNPVVTGWLTGPMDNPKVYLGADSPQVEPQIVSPASGASGSDPASGSGGAGTKPTDDH